MAARLRYRFSNSSTGMGSPCAAEICAASTNIGLTCSADRQMNCRRQERPQRSTLTEEHRSRWGVQTSNLGRAVRRFLVGSTPILFRQTLLRRNWVCGDDSRRKCACVIPVFTPMMSCSDADLGGTGFSVTNDPCRAVTGLLNLREDCLCAFGGTGHQKSA